jgi:SAM-dependent methyltransferase
VQDGTAVSERRAPPAARLLGQLAEALSRPAAHLLIERRLGLDTAGRVSLSELGAGAPGRENYSPVSWPTLWRALPAKEVTPDDVFLDLGAGKGRMLVLAARYPFRRIVGVEVSPALSDVARTNLRRADPMLRCQRVEVVTADAASCTIPDDVTVTHVFNPFTGEVFAAALARLLESITRRPRTIRLIYTNPQPREHALIMATGRATVARQVQPLTVLGNRLGDMPVRVYELRPEASPRTSGH